MPTKPFGLVLALCMLLLADCGMPGPLASVNQMVSPECPVAGDGTLVFRNDTDGYCLLYPSDYIVSRPAEGTTVIQLGSLQNIDGPRLNIEVRAAGNVSTESAADATLAGVQAALPGFAVKRSTTTISGKAAVLLDGLPGQDISRTLVVVSGTRVYKLSFGPASLDAGDAYTRMETLYKTVVDSLRLLD